MKNATRALAIAALLTACSNLAVKDESQGSLIDLQNDPNPTSLATAAQGLMYGSRFDMPLQVILVGSQGREGWSLDPSDAGWRNVMVLFDNTSFYAGSFFNWRDIYKNIKLASVALKATDVVTALSDAQKEGLRGFIKTQMAYDLLNIIVTRDNNGAVLDQNDDLSGPAGPIRSKTDVYARIVQLLDQAQTHLTAAGSTPFVIKLTPGYAGFDTPASFLKHNRALRARVAVYMLDYPAAMTALAGSFVSNTAAMSLGTYHTYTTNSGDALPNPLLFDPTGRVLVAHPSLADSAQLRADGVTKDLRFTQKTILLPVERNFNNLRTQYAFNVYPANTTPVPIIRNEDLILLRAEARWFTNDKAGAVSDIDDVRVRSGGLQPCGVASPCQLTTASTDAQFVSALLYERRYSLVWEGGHRWIDMRRLGRLTDLPLDRPTTDHVFSAWPIPSDECNTRVPQPAGCAQPVTSQVK